MPLSKSLVILAALCLLPFVVVGAEKTLKQAYRDHFYIGVALGDRVVAEAGDTLATVERHFKSVTAENSMKWQPFQPSENRDTTAQADRLVAFGSANDMYVVGHVLFWHNQTPG